MAAGEWDVDPDALARAEAALHALSDDYLRWVEADLIRLGAALAALRAADQESWPVAAEALFAVAHDIKGQAATFGYPLLTRLGGMLCRTVRQEGGTAALARVETLVTAMAEVVDLRLCGDGGEQGRDLVARLHGQGVELTSEG